MTYRIPRFITFAALLAIAIPAVQATMPGQADARPGRIVGESRDKARREHRKQARTNDRRTTEKRSSGQKKNVRPNTRNAPSGPQGNARATGRTRHVRPAPARRTVTRHHHHSSRPTVRRTTRVTARHTTVHHHHHHIHDDYADTEVHYYRSHSEPARTAPAPRTVDGYLTLGLGVGGFAAGQITDTALPGTSFNLGVGGKGRLWGVEVGFNGSGHRFDPQASGSDVSLLGLSADLKLQPSLLFFEPYLLAGVGGYVFQDGVVHESAVGGALRLGFGADVRFDSIALGLRYLYSAYAFDNPGGLYRDLGVQTESVGLNVSFYF